MRIKRGIAMIALIGAVAGCTASDPGVDDAGTDPGIQTPVDLVERAESVADQVEQRQADLEAQIDAQLNDPFSQP